MLDVSAPPLRGPVLFDQQWLDLAFLHWAVSPSDVAPLLPPGTRPDVIDGVTFVGLVPFHMRRAGFGRGLPVPWFGDFLETNVRLYSLDEAGRHGVVFRSLEAERLATVLGARWGYRIPYVWSRMAVERQGRRRRWSSRRRWPDRNLRCDIEIRIGDPVQATELDVFVTARWGMHSRLAGRTLWTPNTHAPWPLHRAELVRLDDELLSAAGFRLDRAPDLPVRWSPGVRTQFGLPTVI